MRKKSRKKSAQKARRAPEGKASYVRLVEFPQARGRTVEKVELSADPDFHCISIRFTDNTDLTVVIDSALTFQSNFSKWRAGNQRVLKRWPVVRSYRT